MEVYLHGEDFSRWGLVLKDTQTDDAISVCDPLLNNDDALDKNDILGSSCFNIANQNNAVMVSIIAPSKEWWAILTYGGLIVKNRYLTSIGYI